MHTNSFSSGRLGYSVYRPRSSTYWQTHKTITTTWLTEAGSFIKIGNNFWTGFKYTASLLYEVFVRYLHKAISSWNESVTTLREIELTSLCSQQSLSADLLIMTTKLEQTLVHRSLPQIVSNYSIQSQLYFMASENELIQKLFIAFSLSTPLGLERWFRDWPNTHCNLNTRQVNRRISQK